MPSQDPDTDFEEFATMDPPAPGDQADAGIDDGIASAIRDQITQPPSEMYAEAHYRYRGEMIDPDFQQYIETELNPGHISVITNFSLSFKLAMRRIIFSFFDKHTLLARFTTVERPMLLFDMEITKLFSAMHPRDANNPQVNNAIGVVRNYYYKLVTRAVGGVENTNQYRDTKDIQIRRGAPDGDPNRPLNNQQPQKKGFGIAALLKGDNQ